MKKLAIYCIVLMMLLVTGCSTNDYSKTQTPEKQDANAPTIKEKPPTESDPKQIKKTPTTVGDLDLGMSLKLVNELLTKKYTEEKFTEDNYFGQEYYHRIYASGIDLVVSEAQGVLQFKVTNPDYSTELGVKVGDNALEAHEKYRAKYQEWVGNQSPAKLIGWFEVQPGKILILDYEKDNTQFNPGPQKNAKIISISSAYTKYFD